MWGLGFRGLEVLGLRRRVDGESRGFFSRRRPSKPHFGLQVKMQGLGEGVPLV